MESLFEQLRHLALPLGDYAIFGSGRLAATGIIRSCNDLDILCRGETWDMVCRQGTTKFLPEYDVSVATFDNGRISFGTTWGIGDFDVDELIDTAEIIESLPFVRLEHVVAYKKIRASGKDFFHLQALRAHGHRIE